ncbi:MAG: GGDEF domain-containing protein [Terriglobia bacterium]
MDRAPDWESRAEELRREMRSLEGRDLQFWSIGILTALLAAAGLVALFAPNLMWNLGALHLSGRYLPQLVFAFTVLIALFNIHALVQRRTLQNTRDELVRQVLRTEAAERLTLVDPLTETFNRRFLDQVLPRDTSRADRTGISLAFVLLDIDDLKSVNTHMGYLAGDKILTGVAALLKKNFRATDTVIRYGGDEFLVIMDDSDEQRARPALDRLEALVQGWNLANSIPGLTLRLSWGVAAYSKGADIQEVLDTADQRMYQEKLRRTAA